MDSNMPKHGGVFLIEDKALEKPASAKPFLETLEWCHGLKFRLKQASNGEELLKHVREWAGEKEWTHSILYFWGHGSPNALWLGSEGSDHRVSLQKISEEIAGVCEESVLVHFGACSTLRLTDDDFLRKSGVAAVSGYRVDVDWTDSLAFEMLYMSRIQSVMSSMEGDEEGDIYLTPDVMRKVWKCLDGEPTRGLLDHLHFDLRIASGNDD